MAAFLEGKADMKKTVRKIILFVFALFVFMVTVFQLISSIAYQENKSQVTRLGFVGTYRITEADTPRPLDIKTIPNTRKTNSIIFTGHFDQNIEFNETLFFKINYLDVVIQKNGKVIYTYGQKGTYPYFYYSAGKVWGRCRAAENISRNDEITIKLTSCYSYNYKSAYSDFFELYKGAHDDVMSMLFHKSVFFIIGAFLLLLFGIILLLAYLFLLSWRANVHVSLFPASGLIISGSLWILCNDEYIIAKVNNGVFLNYFPTVLLILMMLCLASYWVSRLKNKRRRQIAKIMQSSSLCVMILFCLSQLAGWIEPYYIRNLGGGLLAPFLITGTIMLGAELRTTADKIEKWSFYYLIFFCSASLTEIINVPLEFFPTNRVLYGGGVIFLIMQVFIAINILHNAVMRLQRAADMERELAQSRISIMLSQIQPHFLYNALTAIKGICVSDSKRAEETIVSFSDFLRWNMDSLTAKEPIPFSQELTHTRNYLRIEQMRFQHKLRVEYDMPVTDFSLPALTLQPIVENAVRYGVTKKRGGGTVSITTKDTENAYIIVVRDNGLGFDPMMTKEDGRTHIGISNVRDRLKVMINGTLEIESIVNHGTTAIITVPKEEKTNGASDTCVG